MALVLPTLELEHSVMSSQGDADAQCQHSIRWVAGMDEVGRGALAGPVTVGVAVVGVSTGAVPGRLRDSKLLRPQVRERLVPELMQWAQCIRVGSATPAEIDRWGVIGALRAAGLRALADIPVSCRPDLVLLDGAHNWLCAPAADEQQAQYFGPVHTVVKGDMRCASIAAASVVAKVDRDRVMVGLDQDFPQYGWASNKGYGSAVHRAALQEFGVSVHHRRSWKLGV